MVAATNSACQVVCNCGVEEFFKLFDTESKVSVHYRTREGKWRGCMEYNPPSSPNHTLIHFLQYSAYIKP